MADYTDVTQLIADQQFQDWCLNPEALNPVDWHRWATEKPDRMALLVAARASVQKLSLRPDATMTEAAYRSVRSSITNRRAARRKTLLISAALVIALVLSALAFWLATRSDQVNEPVYAVVSTANGTLQPITLPDGSLITLNANSSLRYAEDFLSGTSREAWLEGEAFFTIAPAAQAAGLPFALHTSAGDVVVVGTAFNVRQRENIFEVVLTEGQVKIEDRERNEMLTLLPGERAIRHGKKPLRIEPVETEPFTAWQKNQLVFRNMPLSRVVERLQYDYQLTLQISDQDLLRKRVSATINDGDPFALTLALASIYDLDMAVSTDSTTITLTAR